MKEDRIGMTVEARNLTGYSVKDRNDRKIGTVHGVWEDRTDQPAIIAIKTGWLGMGRSHFVPVYEAEISESSKTIRLPYDEDTIKNAPDFESESDIDEGTEIAIYGYYRVRGNYSTESPAPDWRAVPSEARDNALSDKEADRQDAGAAAREADTAARVDRISRAGESPDARGASMELKEEQVNIGKREVEAGGVRLRKVIRTETVDQPVELSHEEVVVEKVPAPDAGKSTSAEFRDEDVFIPLRKEVPEVSKSARVTEEVQARKQSQSERQNISETVRKEDVEVDKENRDSRRT
ncbi:MAG: hypothetical protein JWO30_424 [Fibrobacteres bacterium]|nr:hypothetical protein [Fibrobacterota bacterium]